MSASVIQRARADDTSSAIDREIQYLANNCPDAYEVTIDYLSSRSADPQLAFDAWQRVAEHIRSEAVQLLRQDGLCSDSAPADSGSSASGAGGLSWDTAGDYVGTNQRICGPLVTTRADNDDVFLNIGRDYPDPARFTIVLWDVGGVESLPAGTTLCTTGQISMYNGVAQIELYDVGLVEVWE
ncbi:hypothetical protein [Microbacterium sp.]|uniref:hypothetical protein n=1 Tax=Microbacterium sp. TaxID=51671 RepID=UPI0028997277|nr:hypothetical protein [Microbacterium sp.]